MRQPQRRADRTPLEPSDPGAPGAPGRNEVRVEAPRREAPGIILPPELELPVPRQSSTLASEPERWVSVVGPEEMASLLADWESLAAAALEQNPFYEPFVALPALHALGSASVRFVLVWATPAGRRGTRVLCGFFPLQRRSAAGRIPLPMLGLWKHRYCYLCTPLIRAEGAQATISALLDRLAVECGPFGVLRMEDVPAEGRYHHLLLAELHQRGWTSLVGESYVRALFRRDVDAETYLQRALGGKRRKELRRQRSRLAELGKLEVEELDASGDVERFIRELVELESRGWKGRSQVALAAHQAERRFFSEMTRAAARANRLMGLTLRLDGAPIAIKHNLLCGDGGMAFKITYDERYARFSPGVLLELENVEKLHARNLRWLDSCAAPNRFMINHLWPERRAVQTLFLAPTHRAALTLAVLPLARWVRAAVAPKPEAPHA